MRARSKKLAVAGVALTAALCGPARADTLDATLTTLLSGRQDPRDGELHTVIPVYQSLSLMATIKRPWTDGMHIVLSGWGGMIFEGPREQTTGDIDVGYLDGTFLKRRVSLRLGRQLMIGGAARSLPMDGGSATVRIAAGLGMTAYGGVPVTPRFAASRGDAMFGGRIFYRPTFDTEVGASFNQIMDAGRVSRQDVALDARYVPYRTVTLSGYALLSVPEARIAEADVQAAWQPHLLVQLAADYRRTAPDLFIPRGSIFSVFSQESRDEVGGTLYARPLPRLRLHGDYHAIIADEGIGHRGGGKASLFLGRDLPTSLNAEVRVLKLPSKGYVQARVYTIHRLAPGLNATLGADAVFLDQPQNGQGYSFTGTATVGYELTRRLRVVLTGIGDVTPLVQRRFEVLAKLSYDYTLRFHEVSP